jgi:tetratricopeptide (TPR) repeat protein
MRTASVALLFLFVLTAGCLRKEIAPITQKNSAAVANSDAVPNVALVPLPGITDDHPAADTTLGLDKAETAHADKPDDPKTNLDLAFSYYKAKAYVDAARCFDRAAQLLPEDPTPVLYLGYTQMAVGALDGALKSFERVLHLNGVSHEVLSEAYYNIGVCDAALNQTDAAMTAYTNALGNNPRNGMASLALGGRAAERGQFGQAKDFFTDAANDLPMGRHKAQAYAALGKLAESHKDTKTAIAQYKKAISIDRDNDWADDGLRRLSPGKKG